MASTRNKNTTGNYNLKQREYSDSSGYTLYPDLPTASKLVSSKIFPSASAYTMKGTSFG